MNNFFLVFISILLVLSGTLLFFYNRDILRKGTGELFDDCVPINLQVRDISSTNFRVEWGTSEECLGFVKYGDSIDSVIHLSFNEEMKLATKRHSILVEDLRPSSVYYFVVVSDGTEYGFEGAPVVVNTRAF